MLNRLTKFVSKLFKRKEEGQLEEVKKVFSCFFFDGIKLLLCLKGKSTNLAKNYKKIINI